ncbi:hypothetical protein [Aminipila terrae]|uniref:Lipoprotein n=1 Tax=Aminipila terrae TaxID=2697030 RepID=A0A6P1MKX7_9FIRM|nr:hypothetical protein [Aminipila terrae]QHI71635.1 hypothetical protein Ami3637_03880 [Aminipila terrae]
MKNRKFLMYLLLILLVIILGAGCNKSDHKSAEIKDVSGGEKKVESPDKSQDESEKSKEQKEDKKVSEPQKEQAGSSPIQKKEPESGDNQEAAKKNVVTVIAKSENNLSDSEKQEMVNQLSDEVDGLVKEINSME